MARIRTVSHSRAVLEVSLSGRLTATDLSRLEHACRQVLTGHPLMLQIDLSRVTHIDEAAGAFLDRLIKRGATVRRSAVSGSAGKIARGRA